MPFFWNILDSKSYKDMRLPFIAPAEGVKNFPYLDTHQPPLPTIGVGFNLRDVSLQDEIIRSIFYPGQTTSDFFLGDITYRDQIRTVIKNTYADKMALQDALNAVMSARAHAWADAYLNDPTIVHPSEARLTFSYASIAEMKPVFDIAAEIKETAVDGWLAGVPNSKERLVLLSLSYNGVLSESNNLRAAINNNNRAEAWYEIRYGSNKGALTAIDQTKGFNGTAARRYGESEMFGLYKTDGAHVDDAEARQIYQTITKNFDTITKYDAKYIEQVSKASAIFGFSVESTDTALADAHNFLIDHYAHGLSINQIWVDYGDVTGANEKNLLDYSTRTDNGLFLGGGGNDVIKAGSGHDVLYGEAGTDKLYGNAGNDILHGGLDGDLLDGGAGQDTADYSLATSILGVSVTMLGTSGTAQAWNGNAVVGTGTDTLTSIEIVHGTDLSDKFSGGNGEVTFIGGAGSDLYNVIWGGAMPKIVELAGESGIDAIGVPLGVTPDNYERMDAGDGGYILAPKEGVSGAVYTIPANIENVAYATGGQIAVLAFPEHKEPPPQADNPNDAYTPFHGAQVATSGVHGDPLVLDLGTQGIGYTAGHGSGSVYWDIDDDGYREQVSWVGPEDGLLALDRNGNGKIDNNSELFGDQPANGVLNGFTQLAALDSNQDKRITAADAQFSNLKVWIDANTDGVSQAGELKTLAQLGITSINLNYRETYDPQGETVVRQDSTFIMNGSFRQIVDAWFSVNQINTEYGGSVTITAAALAQPDLRGYGNLPDLRIAMSLDPALLTLVQGVTGKTLAQLSDPAFSLQDKMTAILFQWAGVQGVDPNSRTTDFDTRKLEFMEKYLGEMPADPHAPPNALGIYIGAYDAAWASTLGGLTGQLLMQTGFAGLYHNPVYNAVTDVFSGGDAQGSFHVHMNIGDSAHLWTAEQDYTAQTVAHDLYILHAGDTVGLTYPLTLSQQGGQGGDVVLLAGIDPSSLRIYNNPYSGQGTLTLQYGAGETINIAVPRDNVTGELSAAEIPRIAFSNGIILDFHNGLTATDTDDSHYIGGTDKGDTFDGRGGSDQLYGLGGNDTLTGGKGIDSLVGGTGDDTYVFRLEDSADGSDYVQELAGEGVDTVRLTGGILPGNVKLTADYAGLHIQYSANDMINVSGDYDYATGAFTPGIERVVFDNGTVWDLRNPFVTSGGTGADELHGSALRDTISGNGGNDVLYGDAGNDTLNGNAGNDTLYGGQGDDQYVYSAAGQGNDIISDEGGAADMVVLGAGYTAANVSLVRVGQYDMAVMSGGSQMFLIQNQFTTSNSIETLKYGDGTTFNLLTYQHTVNGTSGDDYIYGTSSGAGLDHLNGLDGNDTIYAGSGDDIVTGGNGNDTLNGDDGNDTLTGGAGDDIVNGGTGNDTVVYDSGADVFTENGGVDVINITLAGITAANMTLVRPAGSSGDLEVLLNGAHAFNIQYQFYQDQGFETIHFANGSTFNLSTVQYTTNGTAGVDYMYGISFGGNPNDILNGNAGDDYIYGYQGNDVMTGGQGNDFIDGGGGSDVYKYSAGEGFDTISDVSGNDVIQMGKGFVQADLSWVRDGGTNNLILLLKGVQVMEINDQFTQDHQIETVKFADGSTQSLTALSITTNGTADDDSLQGLMANSTHNDVINGLGGNDYIYGNDGNDTMTGGTGNDYLSGDVGNDTYIYNAGDGVDTIVDYSGTDVIKVGAGFTKTDLTWSLVNTSDLALSLKGVLVMTIQNHFTDGQAVESVSFADGTSYALTGMALTLNGTAAADSVSGFSITNDTLNGLDGDDYIYANGGNDKLTGGKGHDYLQGGTGDDTYIFKAGESLIANPDYVQENAGEGTDTIKLTGGILPASVQMWTDFSYLHIRYSATDEVMVQSGYDPSTGATTIGSTLEKISFDNGTVWDLTKGLVMTDTDDTHNISGSSLADTIDGRGGDDTIYGYGGNDTLTGGAGHDYLQGGIGDDTYIFKAGDSPIANADYITETAGEGTDTIKLTGGILPANVQMWTDFYYLHIRYSATDEVTIQSGYDSATGVSTISSYVEKISFDNGTVWDLTNGLAMTDTDDAHNISGSSLSDTIDGRGGDDTIYGYGGNDTITGGKGRDYLQGGIGDDTYIFKAGDGSVTNPDYIIENANEGTDTIKLTGGILPANVTMWTDISYLHIQYSATDQINVQGIWDSTNGFSLNVETVVFDNSTQIDLTHGLTLTDTAENHTLYGTSFVDTIDGKAGSDKIYAYSGNDILTGGVGTDSLFGGAGDDTYVFRVGDSGLGALRDIVTELAGQGTDTIKFTGGILPADVKMWNDTDGLYIRYSAADEIKAGGNIEKIIFDNGTIINLTAGWSMTDTDDSHRMYGSMLNDTLSGRGGNDSIFGSAGNDVITGGDGNDFISGGAGNDTLTGDAGIDTLMYDTDTAGVIVSLAITGPQNTGGAGTDTISGFENLTGSAFNDVLSGNANNNAINGGGGIDTLTYAAAAAGINIRLWVTSAQNTGSGGTDTITNIENLIGSAFNDSLTGSTTDNVIEGGKGTNIMDGDLGIDTVSYEHALAGITINLGLTSAQNTGGAGIDTISFFESIRGSAFNDKLTGDSGNNVIEGGAGNDIMNAGAGIDTASYEHATAGVTVNLATTTAQNTGGAGSDTLSGFENLIGSAFSDTLTGNTGNNVIEGGAGNDVLNGGSGIDTAIYQHASGSVTVDLSAGTAIGDGADTLTSIENVTGSGFNDTFIAGAGANVIDGGLGIDTVKYSAASASVIVDLMTGLVTGSGNDTLLSIENVTGSSYNDTIISNHSANVIDGGLGIDTLSYAQSLSYISASLLTGLATGDGNDSFTNIENLTGSAQGDTLTGNAGANVLNGGGGNDVLYGNGGADTLIGGLGADTFMLKSSTAFIAPITISDFNASQGDKLDISDIIEPFNPLSHAIEDYLQVTTNGANTVVSVDLDGAGTTYSWQQMATLTGVTGLGDEATLVDHGQFVV